MSPRALRTYFKIVSKVDQWTLICTRTNSTKTTLERSLGHFFAPQSHSLKKDQKKL